MNHNKVVAGDDPFKVLSKTWELRGSHKQGWFHAHACFNAKHSVTKPKTYLKGIHHEGACLKEYELRVIASRMCGTLTVHSDTLNSLLYGNL